MNATRRTRVALALASCALITAPAAQASLQSDGRTYGPPASADHVRTTPVAVSTTQVLVPGDRGRSDEGVPSGPIPIQPPPTVIAASHGFDWEDASVGFGAAAGIALLAAGTALSARKLREPRVSI